MAKVITNTYEFAQAIQRQFGCDREVIEQLVERFSENVVIAGDRYAVAVNIVNIAGEAITIPDHYAIAQKLLEDESIDFDWILEKYRETDQDSVGYTYHALKEAVLNMYTTWDCKEIVQRYL